MQWLLSHGFDPEAVAIVDGTGQHEGCGPHYSRRTPGAKGFTGVGQEIVLITEDRNAVWSVVRQRTPTPRGQKAADHGYFVWRNNVFRNLGAGLSSDLIRSATARTYEEWLNRYGELPEERLRTEIGMKKVRSTNPGFCYLKAGWEKGPVRRGILFLYAPTPEEVWGCPT